MLRLDHRLIPNFRRSLNGFSASEIAPSNGRVSTRTRTWWAASLGMFTLISALILFSSRDRLSSPSEHVVLSLQGSTSLGDDLMPKLAAAFLRDDMGAVETGSNVAGIDAKGRVHLHVWGRVPGRARLQVIEVYATGSSAAFECLAQIGVNSCDIGMSSRPINDSDKANHPALVNLVDRDNEHVVALDAIAIIVNPRNPVTQLSVAQLKAIYKGEITNWKQVGGENAPIELFGRDHNSGTYNMLTEKIIGKDPPSTLEPSVVTPDHRIADSELMVNAVVQAPNAIGYVSSPLVGNAKSLAISDGTGSAILPTELSIVTEEYPICRRLLLYDWDAPGSVMDAFVRYVVYKPGQTLVEETPFVELTPRVFHVSPPENAPARYKEIASKYSRIGLSFHFLTERIDPSADADTQLDSLARVNVLRLRTFLAQHNETGNDIILIGFGDEEERVDSSKHVAEQRAEEIATSLRAMGVFVPSENVRNFGADLPLASNETPEGRQRNRRVEVWIRNTPR